MVPRKQLVAKRKKKGREHAVEAYIHRKIMSMTKSQELKQAEIEAIDEVSETKIQQILHEKDDRLQNLIEHERHEGQES